METESNSESRVTSWRMPIFVAVVLSGVTFVNVQQLALPGALVWLQSNAPPEGSIRFEPSALALGNVKAGSKVVAKLTATNSTDGYIQSLQAKSDCSCMKPEGLPGTLAPLSEADLQISYEAPESPGPIRRRIVLTSESSPAVLGSCEITGNVVADIWSIPAEVDILLKGDGHGQSRVRYGFSSKFVPSRISCEDPRVELRDFTKSDEYCEVCVNIKSDGPGAARLKVLNGVDEVICETPVSWSGTPELVFVPGTVALPSGRPPRQIDVYVRINGTTKASQVVIGKLVPWVSKITSRVIDDQKLHVKVQFESSGVPQGDCAMLGNLA